MCWDPDGEGLSPVSIPGLLPPRSLRDDITVRLDLWLFQLAGSENRPYRYLQIQL